MVLQRRGRGQPIYFVLGVDINTIRAWLGHVSLNTTNVYAEVDMEMKAKSAKARKSRLTSGVN